MWRDAEAFFELGDSLVLLFDMLQQHSDDTLDFIGLFAQPRFVNLDRHDADIADSGNHDKINLSPGRERLSYRKVIMLLHKTEHIINMLFSCKYIVFYCYNRYMLLFFYVFICLGSVGRGQEERNAYRKITIDSLLCQLAKYDQENTFVSTHESLPFHIETLLYSPASEELEELNVSEIIEWDGSNASDMIRSSKYGICIASVDSLVIQMTTKGKWHVMQVLDWGLVIDNNSNDPFSFHGTRSINTGRITVKPFEYVHGRVNINDCLSYKYSPFARNIHFQLNNKKGDLSVILRTPSDHIRFGYPLEAIWVYEKKKSRISEEDRTLSFCINSLAVGENVCLIFQRPEKLKQYSRFFSKKSIVVDYDWKNKKYAEKLRTKDQFLLSDEMYELINGVSLQSIGQSKCCTHVKETANMIHSLLKYGNEMDKERIDLSIDSYNKYLQMCDLAISLLKKLTLQSRMQSENQLIAVQDQFMQWQYLESIYGPTAICNLYDVIVDLFVVNDSLNKERLFLLHEALANLGFPRHTGDGGVVNKARKNAFVDAIYRSRCGIVGWSKIHLEEMLKSDNIMLSVKINSSDDEYVPMANAVVESLIRMNRTSQIQPDNLQVWFMSKIVNKRKSERFMNLSTLTLQPSGRQYLLNRLEQEDLGAELRNDIIKHLEARLEATVKTKRYDFMSKRECDRIKKVIGSKI